MIHLSQSAIREVSRLKSKHPTDNPLFRLGVAAGGCSGFYYTMALDTIVTESDRVYECDGIQVAVNAESLTYIRELKIDYSEDLMGGGFRFHNPQANSNCGCGHSFSVEDSGLP
jgi:iron-sulfur cluster assembly accessory protein